MKKLTAVLAISALLVPVSSARSQRTSHSFSFHAPAISSASPGVVSLTGGGTYDPQSRFLQTGGAFRCTEDINQGPFAGLKAGEGVRWHASEVLTSSGFKCSGSAGEPLKTAVTDDDTIVMLALFFRDGDGANPSFTAKVFVSAADEDPGQSGIQNVWIQGIGCGEANTNFR
jgi:hypothetical protein